MYTSDKTALKNCIGHICAAAFLAFFGAVYEHFSHEVYSYYMIYAFAVPLLLGALPFGILALKDRTPDRAFVRLWNSAAAAFAVGSVYRGVLDIYGTTNRLVIVYPIAGAVLALSALLAYALRHRTARRAESRGEDNFSRESVLS
ncbi:MAG: hypothetical protein IJM44_05315 [Ruminococcus sp.]|nr:hypothetical protein [Ruminococcus sp.]